MKVLIEATTENFNDLITAIESNLSLADVKNQLETAIAMQDHDPSKEVPKEGDHPIIDRFE